MTAGPATALPPCAFTSPDEFPAPLRAVDRWRVEPGSGVDWTLHAELTVRADEPALRGHFPGLPIYPGVFALETLGQSLGAALRHAVRLHEVRSVRFLLPLLGGDRLVLTARISGTGPLRVRATGHRGDGGRALTLDVDLDRPDGCTCPAPPPGGWPPK